MLQTKIGTILQWGYAVKGDIEPIAEEYAKKLGVGPFFLMKNARFEEFIHKGEPQDPHIQTAIGYWGDVQIELSQCVNGAKTHHMLGHKKGVRSLTAGQSHRAGPVREVRDPAIFSQRARDKGLFQPGGAAFFEHRQQHTQ